VNIHNFNVERRLFVGWPIDRNAPVRDSFSKCFHILGIYIMIAANLQPIILELNDRPSMIVTSECEAALKKKVMFDAFSHISLDGTLLNGNESSLNWVKILPVQQDAPFASTVEVVIDPMPSRFRT
jgi:hypothetical protein